MLKSLTHQYETRVHFQKSFAVLDEIFDQNQFFPELPDQFEYVDLGCAPGGFSGYLLSDERCVKGTGYTLCTKLGGFPVIIENPRLTVNYTDLLSEQADQMEVPRANFAILDAQYMRNYIATG